MPCELVRQSSGWCWRCLTCGYKTINIDIPDEKTFVKVNNHTDNHQMVFNRGWGSDSYEIFLKKYIPEAKESVGVFPWGDDAKNVIDRFVASMPNLEGTDNEYKPQYSNDKFSVWFNCIPSRGFNVEKNTAYTYRSYKLQVYEHIPVATTNHPAKEKRQTQVVTVQKLCPGNQRVVEKLLNIDDFHIVTEMANGSITVNGEFKTTGEKIRFGKDGKVIREYI